MTAGSRAAVAFRVDSSLCRVEYCVPRFRELGPRTGDDKTEDSQQNGKEIGETMALHSKLRRDGEQYEAYGGWCLCEEQSLKHEDLRHNPEICCRRLFVLSLQLLRELK